MRAKLTTSMHDHHHARNYHLHGHVWIVISHMQTIDYFIHGGLSSPFVDSSLFKLNGVFHSHAKNRSPKTSPCMWPLTYMYQKFKYSCKYPMCVFIMLWLLIFVAMYICILIKLALKVHQTCIETMYLYIWKGCSMSIVLNYLGYMAQKLTHWYIIHAIKRRCSSYTQ